MGFLSLTDKPILSVNGGGVVTTRQIITPAETPSIFVGRTRGFILGVDAGEIRVVNATQVLGTNWRQNKVLATTPTRVAASPIDRLRSERVGGDLHRGRSQAEAECPAKLTNGARLVAAVAKIGKLLWRFPANPAWKASPRTCMIDGRQYAPFRRARRCSVRTEAATEICSAANPSLS